MVIAIIRNLFYTYGHERNTRIILHSFTSYVSL